MEIAGHWEWLVRLSCPTSDNDEAAAVAGIEASGFAADTGA
jgi:hypothetical protein